MTSPRSLPDGAVYGWSLIALIVLVASLIGAAIGTILYLVVSLLSRRKDTA